MLVISFLWIGCYLVEQMIREWRTSKKLRSGGREKVICSLKQRKPNPYTSFLSNVPFLRLCSLRSSGRSPFAQVQWKPISSIHSPSIAVLFSGLWYTGSSSSRFTDGKIFFVIFLMVPITRRAEIGAFSVHGVDEGQNLSFSSWVAIFWTRLECLFLARRRGMPCNIKGEEEELTECIVLNLALKIKD